MSLSTIYGKSGKGAQVLTGKSKSLPTDSMRVLAQIDGKSNTGAILATLEKFSEQELTQILTQLLNGGYIRVIADDSIKDFFPDSGVASTIDVVEISAEEFLKTEVSAHALDSDVKIRQQKEAEARAKTHAAEQLKLEAEASAQKESERKLLEVADLLANSGNEVDIEKLAEQKAREEAAAKAKAEAEAKAKREAEEKARREAEARAKREAEEKAKREAEEKARLAAEQKAREEAAAKAKAEAEAKAKREAEEKARREAEARAKREAEEKAKREAEEKARLAAEQKAREEAAAKAKAEAEAKAKREAEEKARREAEARAKREAEEKAKREAEEKARLAAEQKAREGAEEAVLKARAEMQARAEYVAQEKVQEETDPLAEQEAEEKARVAAEEKAREEAERIARQQAEIEEKALAKLEAKSATEELARAKAEAKAKEWEEREPIDINKWLRTILTIGRKLLVSISVTALVLLFLLQLVNLSMLVSPLVGPIQKLVSENINEPVTINKVYASLWPKPHLVLDGVTIGGLADIKITTIRVLPELSTVFDDVKTLRYIELSGLTVSQENLHRPLQWVSAANKQGKLKFDQVFLEKTSVFLRGLEVPPFDGDIKLTPAGMLQSATLNTNDKGAVVQITPKDETYIIDIVANDWQSPIGAPVVFDELHAIGVIDNNQLTFSQIKGRLYGGNLKATMTVDWANLWTATGTFKLSEVELEEAMPSFTKEASLKGPMTSTATFTLEANEMPALFDKPAINADFSIDDGAINGIDFVRALRANNKNNAINGSTRFNKFSGKLWLKDGRYQYKQLLLKAGKLTASGEADIQANQNISGTIDVSLAVQSRQFQSHLNLSGRLGSPTLR